MSDLASETVVLAMIYRWKAARLSSGVEALGFPTENILEKAGKGRSIGRPPVPDGERTDAEIIQAIVSRMPEEMRTVFEAYYLMLIRGERCRELPHKARALVLGLKPTTYFRRRDKGVEYCQERVGQYLT